MLKLMTAYCDKEGLERKNVRFLYDGVYVNDGDTPNSVSVLIWTIFCQIHMGLSVHRGNVIADVFLLIVVVRSSNWTTMTHLTSCRSKSEVDTKHRLHWSSCVWTVGHWLADSTNRGFIHTILRNIPALSTNCVHSALPRNIHAEWVLLPEYGCAGIRVGF